MSSILKIEKKEMDQLVAALVSRYHLFAPVDIDGSTRLREVKSADELKLGAVPPDESAKAVFFPQTEALLQYERGEAQAPLDKDKPAAVLGIPPCDAKAILTLNRVFSTGKYQDPSWQRRYEESLIIGLGCAAPDSACFCNWMGLGPFHSEGSDVMLTDIGDAYVAESTSDKGERFLKAAYKSGVQRPSEDDLDRAGRVRKQALDALRPAPSAELSVERIASSLKRLWDSPLWDETALECLSCAACSYLCPTCHCFDIQDEKTPGTTQGRRIRIWDTCSAPLFTREASGHNPRPTGKERVRQRVMHKFSYFVENYGEAACVGCGRCIRVCPTGIDIRRIMLDAMRLAPGTERETAKVEQKHA